MNPTKRYLIFAAALSTVWLAGCSTPSTRIKHNPEVFARLDPNQKALVRAGQVGLGMNMLAVELAVGKPDRITERTSAEAQTQIWRYVDRYASYDNAFLYSGHYSGWRGGGWGHRGCYGSGSYGFWGGGPYALRPTRESNRLVIEFKNGTVASIVQEKRR